MVVAVLATLVALMLALALFAAVQTTGTAVPSSVVVLHEQAPDATERNQASAAQSASTSVHDQSPDAKDRNSRGI